MVRDTDEVAETLRRWVDTRGFSGTVLVNRDGEQWQGCFGPANRSDGVPIRPRTRFGVASFTKLLTATTVVALLAEHRLPYDVPVVTLLPQELRPSTLRDDVTVHHLLSHTSGIADYYDEEDEDQGDSSYADLWTDRPAYRMRTTADFLPMFADLPPYGPPGERWRYCNAGYLLLGLIVEQLTGETFIDAVRRRILEPAGMADSGFFALEEALPDIATGYLKPLGDGLPWRSNVYSIPAVGGPDGGLLATAGDIDRFLRALADGRLVGDRRDDMLQPVATVRDGLACGYGIFLHDGPGGLRWGHDGQDPGVEMQADRWRDRDLTVVILCNVTGFTHEVRELVLDAVLDQP